MAKVLKGLAPSGGHPCRLNSGGVVSCVPVESYPDSFNTAQVVPPQMYKSNGDQRTPHEVYQDPRFVGQK